MASYLPPSPGPQMPQKYAAAVGPNYRKWGEIAGYVYVPQFDKYFVDPKALQNQYKQQGLIDEPPKPPGLAQTVGVPAAVLGGAALAQEAGKEIPGYLGGLFGSSGGSAATPALSTAPTLPATQPIALQTAGGGSTGGAFSLGNIGAEGNAILPIAGLIGAGDLFLNKRKGGRGVLQGAGSGAAIGSYFGPEGALIGGGVGALAGLANGLFDRGYSNLEDRKRQELAAQGIDAGSGDGAWESNSDFAKSRDESKLHGEDIIGAADWQLKLGQPWRDTSRERQIEIANEALKRGLVREHNGGIDIDTDGLKDFLKNQTQAVPTPMPRGGLL